MLSTRRTSPSHFRFDRVLGTKTRAEIWGMPDVKLIFDSAIAK